MQGGVLGLSFLVAFLLGTAVGTDPYRPSRFLSVPFYGNVTTDAGIDFMLAGAPDDLNGTKCIVGINPLRTSCNLDIQMSVPGVAVPLQMRIFAAVRQHCTIAAVIPGISDEVTACDDQKVRSFFCSPPVSCMSVRLCVLFVTGLRVAV